MLGRCWTRAVFNGPVLNREDSSQKHSEEWYGPDRCWTGQSGDQGELQKWTNAGLLLDR